MKKHVPRVKACSNPGVRLGGRWKRFSARHGEVPKVKVVMRPDLRLRLEENFDRFNLQFTRRSKWQIFAEH